MPTDELPTCVVCGALLCIGRGDVDRCATCPTCDLIRWEP